MSFTIRPNRCLDRESVFAGGEPTESSAFSSAVRGKTQQFDHTIEDFSLIMTDDQISSVHATPL
jgi:hypothetical protein